MTTTSHRREAHFPPAQLLPQPERARRRRRETAAAAAGLVEAAAAEARAAGAQLRCIHRLWAVTQEARTEARFESLARAEAALAAGSAPPPEPLSPLREAEHQLVLDVAAEVGPALNLPAGTAVRRVEDAVLLAEMLPDVLGALEAGRIGPRQAAVLVEQWRELVGEAPVGEHAGFSPPPVDAVYRLIGELLERAPHATAAQLRAVARRRRAVLVADAEERARRAARKRRCVWVEPTGNGMAYLHALLDAPVALAVRDRLDELVGQLGEGAPRPGAEPARAPQPWPPESAEQRSTGELRADVLADLLLDGILPDEPRFPRGIRGRVTVTVPAGLLAAMQPARAGNPPRDGESLRGGGPLRGEEHESTEKAVRGEGAPRAGDLPQGGEPLRGEEHEGIGEAVWGEDAARVADAVTPHPAVLSGYGPISAEVARQLAAAAGSWHRVLTHPVTGVVLDHDRTVYAVPRDLRRLVELRDGTCRFPGCRRRAERCDLDHTVAWQDGGPTAEDNLAALCRHHHLVKHRPGFLGRWSVRRVADGQQTGAAPGPGAGRAVLEWTSPGGLVHHTMPEGNAPTAGRCPTPSAEVPAVTSVEVLPATSVEVPPTTSAKVPVAGRCPAASSSRPFPGADDPPPF